MKFLTDYLIAIELSYNYKKTFLSKRKLYQRNIILYVL